MNRSSKAGLLEEVARIHGIDASYIDAMGQTRVVSPETLRALLEAMGVGAATPDELEQAWRDAQRSRLCPPPVTVVWGQKPQRIRLCGVEPGRARPISGRIQLEDGSKKSLTLATSEARGGSRIHVDLPALPYGYHQLEVQIGETTGRSLMICAPETAYTEKRGAKRWGIFVPIYALHSKESWGTGDLRDFEQISSWVASLGGSLVGTLPVMTAFLDRPFEASPYSPASRLFWNEFYLHVPGIPEFATSPKVQKLVRSAAFIRTLDKFRQSRVVDYAEEMANKRAVLELMAEFFFSRDSERRKEFDQFARVRPQLAEYARFRAATEKIGSGWTQWPQRLQAGKFTGRDFSKSAERYHMYVQWCAQQQMDKLAAGSRSRGTSLYLDLPLGVNPESFDAWRYRDVFVQGANGGAPPDAFFTKGQDWGFAPLHPQKMRQSGYRYYLEFLRMQMRQTGLLRLDHVMGLHRLYWVPRGFPARAGSYVHYPAKELYAILCLESHRHKTALIGENLGTVPPEVNEAMACRRIKQMYVVQYEQQPNVRAALRPPPKESIASLNTHDMPMFAAHWKGLDILDRADLGLIPPRELRDVQRQRRQANQALIQFLKGHKLLPRNKRISLADVLKGCLRFLAGSQAEFVLVNLEDLWFETEPQNTPSTSTERVNWRRKTQLSLEEILTSKDCQTLLSDVDRVRHQAKSLDPAPKRRRKA